MELCIYCCECWTTPLSQIAARLPHQHNYIQETSCSVVWSCRQIWAFSAPHPGRGKCVDRYSCCGSTSRIRTMSASYKTNTAQSLNVSAQASVVTKVSELNANVLLTSDILWFPRPYGKRSLLYRNYWMDILVVCFPLYSETRLAMDNWWFEGGGCIPAIALAKWVVVVHNCCIGRHHRYSNLNLLSARADSRDTDHLLTNTGSYCYTLHSFKIPWYA